jgi:hypothetical protein
MTKQGVVTAKIATATVLWTTAVAMGITGTVYPDARLMLFWAALVALVACLVTNHLVTECTVRAERIRLEDMVDGLVAKAAERAASAAADEAMDRIH